MRVPRLLFKSAATAIAVLALWSLPGCASAPAGVPDREYLQETAETWEGAAPPGAPPIFRLDSFDAADSPDGKEIVPVLPVRGAALSDGRLWCAADRGLLRRTAASERADGEPPWRFYAGKRWLPDDRVTGLAPDGAGGIWARTATGFARVRFQPMMLEEKAGLFEERLRARHLRHGLVASCRLERPGDLTSFRTRTDDNDGLWTALYVAAEAFRCAATGSAEARENAAGSYRAIERLQTISGLPGFPARSFAEPGEPTGDGEWHATADGAWLWKGDTSSDEVDGHFFAAGIYHDLVASPEERESIRKNVRALADHILDHGYSLVDVDGKPTRWGVWAPEKLNGDPAWRCERGLNSLELLSYLATAGHITGDPKYGAAARDLVEKHGYAENAVCQKILDPEELNHSDDELAFLAYYNLLRYEKDPALRAIYLRSLERSFRIEAPEANPLWTFIAAASGLEEAGAGPGGRGALEAAVRTLRDTPLDMIGWRMENSHRRDLKRAGHPNRFGRAAAEKALHPAERGGLKYNSDPYELDSGGGGAEEDDGAFFLLAYWMGRHRGFIAVPAGN